MENETKGHEELNVMADNVNFEEDDYSHDEHHSHHSHHHHHHHSSGHGHRSSNGSRKKEKAKRFWKRNKYKIINAVVSVMFAVVLVLLGVMIDKNSSDKKQTVNNSSDEMIITDSSIKLEIPLFDGEQTLVSPAVTKYMGSDDTVLAEDVYKDYAPLGRLDIGKSVKLGYSVDGIPEGYSVRSAELLVSENNDFKSSIVYALENGETSVDVYNLKTGTQYYYKFVLSVSNGTKTSVEGSFKTADTPRFLNVDGACNMRDVGGWKTVDGKTVRQGLLYRSAELDGVIDSKYRITSEGVNTILSVLGVKTEMDLRVKSDNPNGINMLGASVKHNYYGAAMYSDTFTENGKNAIKNIFADLADKNNYPVIMHCSHGMDRTGTVCYLLEAVLGVSEDDLLREYQLSTLYHGSLWGLGQMNEFIGRLKAFDGATINEKAESFLLSAGVTEEELANIKEIFLT